MNENKQDDRMVAFSKAEFVWLTQEVNRRLSSMDILLGGLTEAEYKRAKKKVIEECLETLLKVRK